MGDSGTLAPPAAASELGPREIRVIFVGVMLALLLAALDQTIVVTALPTIAADLGRAEALSWIVTTYLVTATASAPLYGKFSDIRGRRIALFLALAVFVVGSVACALSPTMPILIVSRGLQGLGAGGLIAVPMTIVGDIIAPRERGRYQAYLATVYATASIAGPVLGGALSQYAHWSLIFWINLPIAAIALAVAGPALNKLPPNHRPHRLDVLGAILIVGATVTLLLGLTWGAHDLGWTAWQTLSLLAGAVVLAALFALRIATAMEPLIPAGVFANRVVAYGVMTSFFTIGTFTGLTVIVPLYFELVRGHTASQSGITVIPLMIGTVLGASSSGRLMSTLTHYKRVPLLGLTWTMAMLGFIAAAFDQLPDLVLSLALGLISLGLGTVLPVCTVSVQNAVQRHQMGTVTAVNTFCRQLGGALTVAVFGAILVAGGAQSFVLDKSTVHAATVHPGLVETFRWIFLSALATVLMAFLCLFAMEERPLRGRG